MKIFLSISFLFLICLNVAFADLQPNEHFEGTVIRDGVCYEYTILNYSSIGEGGKEISNARILEGICGQNCMDEVYDGPISSYSGDYVSQVLLGGLPMSVDGSGNGILTVPLGEGGFLGPSSGSSCDAKFMGDGSSTLVISHAFLAGFVWE